DVGGREIVLEDPERRELGERALREAHVGEQVALLGRQDVRGGRVPLGQQERDAEREHTGGESRAQHEPPAADHRGQEFAQVEPGRPVHLRLRIAMMTVAICAMAVRNAPDVREIGTSGRVGTQMKSPGLITFTSWASSVWPDPARVACSWPCQARPVLPPACWMYFSTLSPGSYVRIPGRTTWPSTRIV